MKIKEFIDTMDNTIKNQVWIEITDRKGNCLDRCSPMPEIGWVLTDEILEKEILTWSIVMGNYGISTINLKVR